MPRPTKSSMLDGDLELLGSGENLLRRVMTLLNPTTHKVGGGKQIRTHEEQETRNNNYLSLFRESGTRLGIVNNSGTVERAHPSLAAGAGAAVSER